MAFVSDQLTPVNDEFVDKDRKLSDVAIAWFQNFKNQISSSSATGATVNLTGQSATIPTTSFDLGSLSSGLYSVNVYARISSPDSVSSSLTVSLSWTDGGNTMAFSFPAITGNTVTSFGSGVLPVHIDAGSSISYSTTWTVGGVGGAYVLYFAVQRL